MNLLEQIRANLRAKLDQRSAHQAAIDAVTAAAEERGEGTLTEEETAEFTEARDAIVAIDAETTELRAREAELVAAEEARANADALATRLGAAPAPVDVRNVRQPDLYNAGGEHSFFSDAYRAQFSNDRAAADRLARHSQFEAESRDASVASFGALIPPQYLVNGYAQIARAGRPYSNSIMSLPLPARGTTFNIPRGTTGTTTATQASEGDSVSETDFDETTLAVSVRTIAGAQDISRQALERGEGVDAIIYADLAAAYAVALDTANLTSLLALSGTEAVTYTDASPTVAELWPKLADAIQRVNSLRFAPATAIYMHPRRWGWMTAPVDSTAARCSQRTVPSRTPSPSARPPSTARSWARSRVCRSSPTPTSPRLPAPARTRMSSSSPALPTTCCGRRATAPRRSCASTSRRARS